MPSRGSRDTRRELIELGVAALLDLTPAALMSAAGMKDIAARAGVGVTTIFHHFGSVEGYADAVVARIYDPDVLAVDTVADRADEVRVRSTPLQAAQALHRSEFERLSGDREFRIRLGLWALGGPAVDGVYAALLREIDTRIGEFSSALFHGWGRELRPPIDLPAYLEIQNALVTGAVLRGMIDPAAIDVDRFAQIAPAVSIALLRPQGDRRTLGDRLAELNYYPGRTTRSPAVARGDDSRDRILTAAEDLFRRQGFAEVTMARLARDTGLSTSTLYRHFDDMPDVAVHLLLREFVAVQRPQDGLVECLGMVGEFVGVRVDYLAPYVATLAVGGTSAVDPILAAVRFAVGASLSPEGRRRAVDGGDAMAHSLLIALVSRILAAPGLGAAHAVDHVLGLLDPRLWADEVGAS